jgi:hypothetical protein
MSQSLHITDELYAKLKTVAESQGQSPDTFAAEVLASVVDTAKAPREEAAPTPRHLPPDDPFFQLAGSLHSGRPIPADRYDEYLAEEIADAHNDEP